MPTKAMVLAQVFISGMMALVMTGFFTFLHSGLTTAWLIEWSKTFILAWPVVFCLALVIGRIGFKLAHAIMSK